MSMQLIWVQLNGYAGTFSPSSSTARLPTPVLVTQMVWAQPAIQLLCSCDHKPYGDLLRFGQREN